VEERVFETVPRCLDEPLPVGSPAKAERESTKKILNNDRHPPSSEMAASMEKRKYPQEKGERSMQVGCVRTEITEINQICMDSLDPYVWGLGHGNRRLQSFQLVTEHLALLGKGNLLRA
jgi:hypothetical protein